MVLWSCALGLRPERLIGLLHALALTRRSECIVDRDRVTRWEGQLDCLVKQPFRLRIDCGLFIG
jgi:hypothetical protein